MEERLLEHGGAVGSIQSTSFVGSALTIPGQRSTASALVTGASGVLGRQLVRHLVSRGWMVNTLTRSPCVLPAPGVTNVVGNVLDADAARRATEGVNVVFHLAARRTGAQRDESIARVNIDGTLTMARAARAAGVATFVYFGSTAVYGDTTGTNASELSTPAPASEYARTKLEGEVAALDEAPGTVVLRFAAVYGSHHIGNYFRLARLCQHGVQLTGNYRRTLVYEDDAMEAALLAAQHTGGPDRIFNITDGSPHTLTAITTAILAGVGRTRARLHLPAARLAPLGTHLPIIGRHARKVVEDSAIESLRARTQLTFVPTWGLERGWRVTIEQWRDRGLL